MDMKLPELGEGVLEAEFVDWLIAPGQDVKMGDPVAEVLTDKAAVVLPSPFTGRVLELLAQPGQSVPVGAVVLHYEAKQAAANTPPTAAVNRVDAVIESKDVESKTVKTKAEKSPVEKSKAVEKRPAAVADQISTATNGNGAAHAKPQRPKAAPAVRRRARELNVDLARVPGSGPGGRILMDDVVSFAQSAPSANVPAAAANQVTAKPASTTRTLQPGTSIPMRGVRKKIAEHMVRSKTEIPHYSFVDECNVTELVRIREQLKPGYKADGVRLTYLAFIVKAVAESLTEFPLINASLSDSGEEILLHDEYHIGVAVATDHGLVVPVIRDADKNSVKQIAATIQSLGEAARNGSITRDDLRGATFVVTSIGGIGGLISTPIINQPNVGIMGVGRVVRRPMYDDAGSIYPAEMLYLSYSFDHRVVDGAIGAEFNNAVIRRLNNPAAWLIPN